MTDVLVVDDEEPVLELVTELLSDEGYSVASAPDGQAALELIARGVQPALVITDLKMPRVTGVELAAAIRARHGSDAPPVVLMSADPRWLDDVEGVTAKLRKPFRVEALLDLVDRHCRADG